MGISVVDDAVTGIVAGVPEVIKPKDASEDLFHLPGPQVHRAELPLLRLDGKDQISLERGVSDSSLISTSTLML